MTKEESKRVLEIMAGADGGCVYCAKELFLWFIKEFPEFEDLTKSIFKDKFCNEIERVEKDQEELS